MRNQFDFIFIFYLFFHLQHMEVPGLRVESELQLWSITQARQHQIRAASATYGAKCSNAGFFIFYFILYFILLSFLGPHPRHMESPRLGVQSEV